MKNVINILDLRKNLSKFIEQKPKTPEEIIPFLASDILKTVKNINGIVDHLKHTDKEFEKLTSVVNTTVYNTTILLNYISELCGRVKDLEDEQNKKNTENKS